MDELFFDEILMKEKMQNSIIDFYKNDNRYESKHWYKVFGNRNLKPYSSISEANSEGSKCQFPCFVLSIQSRPDTMWSTSTQIEEVSRVDFSIELFTKKVQDNDKETLNMYLSNIVTLGLRQLSPNITITKNAPLINFDTSICRRIVRGVFKYNNLTKTFSKGE